MRTKLSGFARKSRNVLFAAISVEAVLIALCFLCAGLDADIRLIAVLCALSACGFLVTARIASQVCRCPKCGAFLPHNSLFHDSCCPQCGAELKLDRL